MTAYSEENIRSRPKPTLKDRVWYLIILGSALLLGGILFMLRGCETTQAAGLSPKDSQLPVVEKHLKNQADSLHEALIDHFENK